VGGPWVNPMPGEILTSGYLRAEEGDSRSLIMLLVTLYEPVHSLHMPLNRIGRPWMLERMYGWRGNGDKI
jgi:hypothetical protein